MLMLDHRQFSKNDYLDRCPKAADYTEKLLKSRNPMTFEAFTAVRVWSPCRGGIEYAAKRGAWAQAVIHPRQVVTIDQWHDPLEVVFILPSSDILLRICSWPGSAAQWLPGYFLSTASTMQWCLCGS